MSENEKPATLFEQPGAEAACTCSHKMIVRTVNAAPEDYGARVEVVGEGYFFGDEDCLVHGKMAQGLCLKTLRDLYKKYPKVFKKLFEEINKIEKSSG